MTLTLNNIQLAAVWAAALETLGLEGEVRWFAQHCHPELPPTDGPRGWYFVLDPIAANMDSVKNRASLELALRTTAGEGTETFKLYIRQGEDGFIAPAIREAMAMDQQRISEAAKTECNCPFCRDIKRMTENISHYPSEDDNRDTAGEPVRAAMAMDLSKATLSAGPQMVEELPGGWVPVELCPAPRGERLLVLRTVDGGPIGNPDHPGYGSDRWVEISQIAGVGGRFFCDFATTGRVTHWMPLPPTELG